MGLGELNDNMIKGLMILLKLSWVGSYLQNNYCYRLMWYRIKQRANTSESQACCEEKQETRVHAMTTIGFYIYGLAHLRYKLWKHYCKASWIDKNKRRHTLVSKIYWFYLWKLAMGEIWLSFMITMQDKEMKIWE